LLTALVLSACGNGDTVGSTVVDVPGLDPDAEIEIVEVEPAPSDESYAWTHAVQVEGLPPVNVGHPTSEFLDDAHRVGDDPEDYLCTAIDGSGGCSVEDPDKPSVAGLTAGGPDVVAWEWSFVPDDAAAVTFTDRDGRTTWQRPLERMVIFPDADEDDPDGMCRCRFDAVDRDGEMIVSIDAESGSYIDE
jgi:hypothetical protein